MNNELMAIRQECLRRQTELGHTMDVCARSAAAVENRSWCELHLPELTLNYKSRSAEYWRHYGLWFGAVPNDAPVREIDDQIREGRLYRFGRFAFLLVEAIAGAVLAAIFFNAPRWFSAIIGIVLALLLGAAATALVTRWVRRNAAEQPTKQMERITRGLIMVGLPWFLACVSALVVLRTHESTAGAAVFLISTTAVTLLSPLCSGLCGYASDLLLWSKRLCADLRWIRQLARQLDHLLMVSFSGHEGETQRSSISNVLHAIGPTAAGAILVITLFGHPVPARAGTVPVRVYPDVSPSARPGDVDHILKDLAGRLSNYHGTESLSVSVIPFFENAFMAPTLVSVNIPGRGSSQHEEVCDKRL